MSYREANLAVLRRLHPAVARAVEELSSLPPQGVWTVSRSGLPTVKLEGTHLASSYDPTAEASKAVPDWDDTVDFAVLAGLGAGYLAEAVSTRYSDLPLVLVEENPRWFSEVLDHRDLTSLWSNPRLTVLVGPASLLGDFLKQWSCRTVEILSWRPLTLLSPRWSRETAEQVARAQALVRVNLATYARFAGLWQRNLARNQAQASVWQPVRRLTGWRKGVPAVIAAAGPSLSSAFEWIETHRRQIVLIAVDTAWSALYARGVIPDVLLVLDGQYWNSRHLDKVPPPSTVIVTEWIGPPRAFRLAPQTYVAASSVPFLRWREIAVWGPLGELPSGGSVATAAFSLAQLMGCSEIAFAGLDLGYPKGQTHVQGSQFEEAVHRTAGRLLPAETRGLGLRGPGLSERPSVDGGTVLSDSRMDVFRDWLSAAAARSPIAVVNLSPYGSLVPGLLSPPVAYGDKWLPTENADAPTGPHLERRTDVSSPPFHVLEQVAGADDFAAGVEAAWSAARGYWGDSVWEPWAGRAKRTWDRWPSARSRRAVEEIIALTLDWRRFWEQG